MPAPALSLSTAFLGRVLSSLGDCTIMARALLTARSARKPAGAQLFGGTHYDYVPPFTQCKFHGNFIIIFFFVHKCALYYIYRETGRGKIK